MVRKLFAVVVCACVSLLVISGVMLPALFAYDHASAAIGDDASVGGAPRAKNVILFIGDGMGVTTVTAARWFKGSPLCIDTFPETALVKTDSYDRIVTDSAAAITAFTTGHKTKNGVLCMSPDLSERYETICEIAKKNGKATGIVTTTRVTHATPAGCYAHVDDRDKEDEIAWQLFESDMDVIIGGGRKYFLSKNTSDPEYPDKHGVQDRDLTEMFEAKGYTYVWNEKQFRSINPKRTDKLLALFEYSHMHYEADRDEDVAGEPSLADMTETAIKILSRDEDGFFLMVEGGRIDHAHHENKAYKVLTDTLAFDDAVERALSLVNLSETLIIVVADHSHPLTIQGYPLKNTSILGIAGEYDGNRYPILIYGSGPEEYDPDDWQDFDPTNMSEDELKEVVYPCAVPRGSSTHDGGDVVAYAIGPCSELVDGTLDNTDLFRIMRYAMFGIDSQILEKSPTEIANESEMVQDAWNFLLNFTNSIEDDELREKCMDLMEHPVISCVADDGYGEFATFQQPFWSAPGSGWNGHHSYPGGLAVHVAENARMADAFIKTYEDVQGVSMDSDVVKAAVVMHDIAKPVVFRWTDDMNYTAEEKWPTEDMMRESGAMDLVPEGHHWEEAKTGQHHILAIAELYARDFPNDVIIATASAHADPGKDLWKINVWLRVAAYLADKEPLTVSEDEITLEMWASHYSDHLWIMTSPTAEFVKNEIIPELASDLGIKPGTKEFNNLCNIILSNHGAVNIYDRYVKSGYNIDETVEWLKTTLI